MKTRNLTKSELGMLAKYNITPVSPSACIGIHYDSGEKITDQDSSLHGLVILIHGTVEIYRTNPEGKDLILSFYLSEGMLGEVELIMEQRAANASSRAVSDVEGIYIEWQYALHEVKTNVNFSNAVGKAISNKLLRSEQNYVRSALSSAEDRLCFYIVNHTTNGMFRDVMSDVSSTIGVSYRHLFRLLDQLCKERILAKTVKGYVILNQKELKNRASNAV
jgi:cAMP-binding proteins - catabolite gene activator and regulatory subunit of cAMP-dependent protein kinases